MTDSPTQQDATSRIGRYVPTVAFDEAVNAYVPPPCMGAATPRCGTPK